ncbi:MAG: L-dopachrome tautomerase-related protein [Syntrophorhabdales bacterium]
MLGNMLRILMLAILPFLCSALDCGAQTVLGSPLEVVASISSPDLSGMAVTADGRVFIGFPRHADNHSGPTLAEYKDGALTPFPNAAMSLPGGKNPADRLVSVHGMTMDTRGRLWVIDDGKEAGQPIKAGAAKIVGFDVDTGRTITKVILSAPVLLSVSHMNDLRIDLTHGSAGTAFVTDSSFGTEPALVVVDLASGRSRRILEGTAFVGIDKSFATFLDFEPHVYSRSNLTFPIGGADGITLSPDSSRLYWTSLTGRRLFSAPTAVLSNLDARESELVMSVRDEGERPPCDGIATDPEGRIYFGALDQESVVRRNADGTFTLIAHDPRLTWPDALQVANGYLYVTLGQWNRHASFNGGHDLRVPPYLLVRIRLD